MRMNAKLLWKMDNKVLWKNIIILTKLYYKLEIILIKLD